MDNTQKVKNIIEALLVVAEGGLSRRELQEVIGDVELAEVSEGVDLLRADYASADRSFSITEIAGKLRIATKPEYMPWISKLFQREPDRLSGPSLETLAIIAYKQPATRAEIESVRGVNAGGVLNTLLEKDLITIKGRKDVPGKPFIYGTTDKFLELFGLNSLDDLPMLKDFSEEDLVFDKPREEEIVELDKEVESGKVEE